MAAQSVVQFSAQPLNEAPALGVQDICAELHRDAVLVLEGVDQQHRLHSVFSPVHWRHLRYQVEPISSRWFAASTFM